MKSLSKKLVLFLACVMCIISGSNVAAQDPTGRQLTPPNYVFEPNVPHDLVTKNLGAIGTQPFVNNLAWESFIALNWPIPDQVIERGVPDQQKIIGGAPAHITEGGKVPAKPAGPVVWETYKDSADLFLADESKPTPFDAAESIPDACKGLALKHPQAAARTLVNSAKISDVLQSDLQAFTGARLIDQNGKNVWYDIKVNRTYYDFVVNNKYYIKSKVPDGLQFPASSNTSSQEGTLKIKAAWKVMGDSSQPQPDDVKTFYTTDALIYDKSADTCSKQTVGLVGLHVVKKTKQLPQWMWATFEHVDNAPTDGERHPNPTYNFYNTKCGAKCPINTPPSSKTDTTPTQVVRLTALNSNATQANQTYQTALKMLRKDNVWSNYMLVDAQWGETATPLGVPNQPRFLANTTMETYLQGPTGDDTKQPHGCINCHGKYAGNHDLDFQLP